MASDLRKIERERLAFALLAVTGKLVAARAAMQHIEDTEIVYERCADPTKAIRRLRHPEKEDELRSLARTLQETIAEQSELHFWILQELEVSREAA
jgi:hypothetical protein